MTIHEVYIFDPARENTLTHKLYLSEALAERRAHRLRLLGEDANVAPASVNSNGVERTVHLAMYADNEWPAVFSAHTTEAGAEEAAKQLRRMGALPARAWVERHPLWWDEERRNRP